MKNMNLKLDVELTVQKGPLYTDEPTVLLAITDRLSGTRVTEVQLTAGQLVSALSGTYLSQLDGWFTPVPERIGKQMQHRTLDVPREVIDKLPYKGDARELAARAWGQAHAYPDEEVETRSTNTGWKVILRRYAEVG